jgi:FkbM family methyltransferase
MIKSKIQNLFNFLIKTNPFNENRNISMIDKRYTSGEILFYEKKFKYLDKASFDYIFNELFVNNIYKFKTATSKPFIIDCGANIGLSVIYFKRNFPNSKILAFEADPDIFNVLEENLSQFNYNDVTICNRALWDEETEISFFSEGADAGRIENKMHPNKKYVKCKTVKLSSFLNKKVDLLKIDIEGAEVKVLNECKELLINVDKLFVEFHSFSNLKQELSVLLQILEENNFRYYISNTGGEIKSPFINITEYYEIDNSLNIFAYR